MSNEDDGDWKTPPTRPGLLNKSVHDYDLRSSIEHLSIEGYPGGGSIVLRDTRGCCISITAGDVPWVLRETRRIWGLLRKLNDD